MCALPLKKKSWICYANYINKYTNARCWVSWLNLNIIFVCESIPIAYPLTETWFYICARVAPFYMLLLLLAGRIYVGRHEFYFAWRLGIRPKRFFAPKWTVSPKYIIKFHCTLHANENFEFENLISLKTTTKQKKNIVNIHRHYLFELVFLFVRRVRGSNFMDSFVCVYQHVSNDYSTHFTYFKYFTLNI